MTISEVLNTAIENIDQLARNDEEITGLPTGYAALDKMTAGLQAEELIILAARPAVGKTAFALNIAQNVGTKTDKSVAILVWKWVRSHWLIGCFVQKGRLKPVI